MVREWTQNGQGPTRTEPGLLGMAGMDKESSRSLGMNKEWTRSPPGMVGECKVLNGRNGQGIFWEFRNEQGMDKESSRNGGGV